MKTLDLWCVDTLLVSPLPCHIDDKRIEGLAGSFPCFYTEELARDYMERTNSMNTGIRKVIIVLREDV